MNGNGDQQPSPGSWLYVPLGTAFFLALAIVGLLVIGLVALDAMSYVYHRIGISLRWMAIIMVAGLVGSVINIPVAGLRAQPADLPDQGPTPRGRLTRAEPAVPALA